jgi:hypothetical protein
MHKFQFSNCKLSHEGAQISYRNAVLALEAKQKPTNTSDQTLNLREGCRQQTDKKER